MKRLLKLMFGDWAEIKLVLFVPYFIYIGFNFGMI